MKSYTIHQPPVPAYDPMDQADELVFIKDGFAWLALIPFTWMIYHRLWLELVVYLVVMMLLSAFMQSAGVSQETINSIGLFANIAFAFEANNLRRAKLGRKDYNMVGAVTARNLRDAELKFFMGWEEDRTPSELAEALIPGTPASTSKLVMG